MGLTNQAQRITALQQVPLLCCLNRTLLGDLVHRTQEVTVSEGAHLYREGDSGDEVYIILDGSFEVRRDTRRITTSRRGDFFGEMSLIEGMRRTENVVALEESVVLVVHREDFELLLEIPQVARAVIQELATRVRAADEKNPD